MARRLLPCLCLVLFFASTSFAQNLDYPKFDFTEAFTFNHAQTPSGKQNLYGFTEAGAYNFKRYFAVEGDLTYTWKTMLGTENSLLTYLVGPRFTKRPTNSKLQPFVHALIGGGYLTAQGANTKGWAGKFGGGLDIVAGKHVAIRVVQVDYYRYHGHVQVGKQRFNDAALTFGVRIF